MKVNSDFQWIVCAIAIFSLLAPGVGRPESPSSLFVIDTTNDTLDASPGDGACADSSGDCSLRAAISEANALAGADTISLPAGVYTLTRTGPNEDGNLTGDLDVTSEITINGAGAGSTFIQAGTDKTNGTDRVLQVVNSNGRLTLNDLTVRYGKEYWGGTGIYISGGTVNLYHCAVSDNTSGTTGGGVTNNGTLNLDHSTISGNSSNGDGGGIYNSGTLNLNHSTLTGNSANINEGGGVYCTGNTTINYSTFTNNSAHSGGGLFNHGNTTINSSTFYNNNATNGGGVCNYDAAIMLYNVTLSGNTAGSGGGLYNFYTAGVTNLVHSTVTGNNASHGGGINVQAGAVNLKNTIVAGNTGTLGNPDCSVSVTSLGYNLVGSGTGCPSSGTGDQTTGAPLLGPLADNSGPTQTHALLPGSPALDAIPDGTNGCGSAYTADQRGLPRPTNGACDVGAFEKVSTAIWDNGGNDNLWSTAANWVGDLTPTSADIVIFNHTSDANASLDANFIVAGVYVEDSYDGVISQGSYDLVVSGDWTQSGGTFTAGSGRLDLNGAFDLSGGSFTAPDGMMSVSGGFQHTGGTFDPNGGRLVLDNTTNQSLATTFHDLVINDGLLGYWKLDEGSGTTTADASGYGYHGTLLPIAFWSSAAPWTMDFHDPGSLWFNGTDAYVDIPNTPEIDDLGQFTLSAWISLFDLPAGTMNFVANNQKAALRYNNQALEFYVVIDDAPRFLSASNVLNSTSTWMHVAGSYDGSTMRLYLNGAEQPGAVSITGVVDSGDGVHLSDSAEAMWGNLDDVRIYNRALSTSEISDLAQGKHPQTSLAATSLRNNLSVTGDLSLNSGTLETNLPKVVYWKLDDGSGTTAADSSGNAHHGTLVNMEAGDWVATTAPTGFSNPYALQFDGVNEYAEAAIDVSESAYALSLWFKTSTQNGGLFSVDDGRVEPISNDRHVYLSSGNLCASIWAGELICTSGINFADGAWHHVVHTYGGAVGGQKLYVDGIERASGSKPSSDFVWQKGINIGWSNDSNPKYFQGTIDDMRIYDTALSQAQVQALAGGDEVSFDINLLGDFTRNGGVFTAGNGSFTFAGSAVQILDTDAVAFYDLTVGSGSTLLDAAEFTVSHVLTNNGTLQREKLVDGSAPVSFFDTGGYGGLAISDANLGSTTVLIQGNRECTPIPGETVRRCFEVTPGQSGDARLLFYFALSELAGNDCNAMNAYRWTGSAWQQLPLDATWGGDGRLCDSEPYSVRVYPVSEFSRFVLADGLPADKFIYLPVALR